MKQIVFSISFLFLFSLNVCSQGLSKLAPRGFDSVRQGIHRGKIDTIYELEPAGTSQKAFVYTPPVSSKSKESPVLCLLRGNGGNEKEWLNSE